MRLTALAAAALALMSSVALAEAPHFEPRKSPGGIEFWYRARPDLTKDTFAAGWRDGVGFTLPGKEGLSRVGGRMLWRAGTLHLFDDLFSALRGIGAHANIYTNGSATFATLVGSLRNFDAAAGLANNILAAPLPGESDLERIEDGLVKSVGDAEQNPELALEWAARRLGQPKAPGNAPYYNPAAYSTIAREDVETWRRRVLARDNLTIAVEGPSSADELGRIFDRLAQPLPEKSDAVAAPEMAFSARPQTIVIESAREQTSILAITPTRIGRGPERLRFVVALQTLGDGADSRLAAALREKLGDAYETRAGLTDDRSNELAFYGARVANDRAPEALAAMRAAFAAWRDNGARAAEVEATASRLKASFDERYFGDRYSEEENAPRDFVEIVLAGQPANTGFDYAERLASFTADNVNAAVRAKIPAGPWLTLIMAPSAAPFHADCVIKSWREVDKCR